MRKGQAFLVIVGGDGGIVGMYAEKGLLSKKKLRFKLKKKSHTNAPSPHNH